ncbi:hypothetical protein ACQEVB_32375 [Pseudonocardia sp. CA-107938]|uniref:hypothetical protein n=1 Tax=Pseudonocardia sp. CA-107938 TaxID=3240021 RepID=UPI003D8F7A04
MKAQVVVATAELARLQAVDERARWAASRSMPHSTWDGAAAVAAACIAQAEWIHTGQDGLSAAEHRDGPPRADR